MKKIFIYKLILIVKVDHESIDSYNKSNISSKKVIKNYINW